MNEEATQEEIDRFMSYVDKLPNGCWFWTGGRSRGKGNRKWYGTFWFRGKSIRAHRFSADYIGKCEPLPKGKHRDHTCVFSLCVNYEHLEKVSPAENQQRKIARRGLTKEAIENQLPLNQSALTKPRCNCVCHTDAVALGWINGPMHVIPCCQPGALTTY